MPLGMEVGSDFVLDGDQAPPSPKRGRGRVRPMSTVGPIKAHVYCGQTAGWTKMPWYGGRPRPRRLCVRWGPSSPRKKGTVQTQFLAHVYCGQAAGWIRTPLGTEVNLGPGEVVLYGVAVPPIKRAQPPVFCSCMTKRLDG